MQRTRLPVALLSSLGLHAMLLTHALASRAPTASLVAKPEASPAPAPVWPGETFDIDALAPASDPPPGLPALPAPVGAAPEPGAPVGVAPEPGAPVGAAPAAAAPEPALPAPSPREPAAPEPAPPAPRAAEIEARPASASGSSAAASTASAPAAYGQAGLLAVAAPLGKGLLRVLPRVAFVESTFHDLPVGATGRLRFQVDLDAEGRPTLPLTFEDDRSRPRWLEPVVGRAVLLLRGGTFSLDASSAGARALAFELSFEIAKGEPAVGDWLEPRDLAEIGRLVEPTLAEPGRAHFRYNSGRRVQLVLRLLDPKAGP